MSSEYDRKNLIYKYWHRYEALDSFKKTDYVNNLAERFVEMSEIDFKPSKELKKLGTPRDVKKRMIASMLISYFDDLIEYMEHKDGKIEVHNNVPKVQKKAVKGKLEAGKAKTAKGKV